MYGFETAASLAEDTATVVSQIFNEADRRDPHHQRTWVALVDGNNHQIGHIRAQASTRGINIAIICCFVSAVSVLPPDIADRQLEEPADDSPSLPAKLLSITGWRSPSTGP